MSTEGSADRATGQAVRADLNRYDSDVVLRDGSTIHLRAITPDDAAALLEFLRGLSPASLYFRFFSIPRLDEPSTAYLARVDYQDQFALIAELGGRIVGVTHFFRSATHPDRAEVAFAIADTLQGRGLGTRLLERLAEIARDLGVATFEAAVLAGNQRMMDVFVDCGFEVTRRLQGGVYHVALSLEPTPAFEDRAAERAQLAATASMRHFFEPRVVALVGASRKKGHIGAALFDNLSAGGFTGTVVPVNPNAAEVGGVRTCPRVSDIDGPVDLAVVAVPAPHVDATIDDCVAKGVKAIVVISAGFGETGVEGRKRELAILEKVRTAGIRLIGPNCMGLLNTDSRVRLNATFYSGMPPEGRVAFLSQSGALGLAILDYAQRLNIGISSFVSVGNKTDVSGNDLIQYWAEDERTGVILLYLESFGNPNKFGRIARRVSRQKPIVAVKAGRSRSGARAASSHTGALAASDAVVDGLFRQAGIIRTTTLEELFDVATLLAHQPAPAGRRVAILTNGGGPGILAADACEAHGLDLPTLGDQTIDGLRAFLPSTASVANPVDMIASATADDYGRAIRLLLADESVDSLLVIFIPPIVANPDAVARAIVDASASRAGKPILAVFMSAHGAPTALRPIPAYSFPESAAIALARVTTYGEWLRTPPGSVPSFPDIHEGDAQRIVARALARGGGWLAPDEAGDLLAAVGIPSAPARLAATAAEAAQAAGTLGYPVALKAIGPTIVHKTEVGGVKLRLADETAVLEAYADLVDRLGTALTGVLVQRMVAGGVEVMLGAVQDPTFGPLVLYGSGGTLVELWSDVAFRIHPVTDADVAGMLNEVKGTALLRGFRGAPPADEAALCEMLLRISALIEICPEIREMDLNPVKVLNRGASVIDARVRVDRRPSPPPTRRIAY